jgi:hypothetical protein
VKHWYKVNELFQRFGIELISGISKNSTFQNDWNATKLLNDWQCHLGRWTILALANHGVVD